MQHSPKEQGAAARSWAALEMLLSVCLLRGCEPAAHWLRAPQPCSSSFLPEAPHLLSRGTEASQEVDSQGGRKELESSEKGSGLTGGASPLSEGLRCTRLASAVLTCYPLTPLLIQRVRQGSVCERGRYSGQECQGQNQRDSALFLTQPWRGRREGLCTQCPAPPWAPGPQGRALCGGERQ